MAQKLIQRDKGIIIACDCDRHVYLKILRETKDLEEVVGYKLGFPISSNLPSSVFSASHNKNKVLIDDHQKAGTDVPDTAKDFAESRKDAGLYSSKGIDAVILFPRIFGLETERAYIKAVKEASFHVLVGGLLTNEAKRVQELQQKGLVNLPTVEVLEYFAFQCGWQGIYKTAIEEGVSDFVLPGNILAITKEIKSFIEIESSRKQLVPCFYTPGIGAQGGKLTELAELFKGSLWYPIIGRSIYENPNIKEKVKELSQYLG